MKKLIYIFIAVLFMSVSCTKSDNGGSEINLEGCTVFDVDTEQIDIIPGQSFQSTWPKNASIGVFSGENFSNVEYFLKRSGIGQNKAVFYGPVVKGKEFTAYYPYSAGTELEGGLLPCNLASDQEYTPSAGATDQFLKYSGTVFAHSEDGKLLEFRYPFGILSIQICFDDILNVRNMTLSSSGNAISGRMLVSGLAEVTPSSVASFRTTLSCAEPVASGDGQGNFVKFYFILPPAEYESQSLVLNVDAVEDEMNVVLKKIVVERVKGVDSPITNVVINSSDLPEFIPVDGYLE